MWRKWIDQHCTSVAWDKEKMRVPTRVQPMASWTPGECSMHWATRSRGVTRASDKENLCLHLSWSKINTHIRITTAITRLWVTSSWYLRWRWITWNLCIPTARTLQNETKEIKHPVMYKAVTIYVLQPRKVQPCKYFTRWFSYDIDSRHLASYIMAQKIVSFLKATRGESVSFRKYSAPSNTKCRKEIWNFM